MIHQATFLLYYIIIVLCNAQDLPSSKAPNVILILCDDISFDQFSYVGGEIETKNIDSLATGENSLIFSDFHVSTSCAPTRASLLTGRYSEATGIWHTISGRSLLRDNEITIGNLFKHNQYATGFFGKWHLGDNQPFRPIDRGFDTYAMCGGGGVSQVPDFWGSSNLRPSQYLVNGNFEKLDALNGNFSTDFFTRKLMKFCTENIENDRPFFAYFAPTVAHGPVQMPPSENKINDPLIGMVKNFDRNIGRLIQLLTEKNALDNTWIVFTTDNGFANKRYTGAKLSLFEGGHRVPCFIKFPTGVLQKPGVYTGLTTHLDIFPTLVEMLNLTDPLSAEERSALPVHGVSLANSIRNETLPKRSFPVVIATTRKDRLFRPTKDYVVLKDQSDVQLQRKWRLLFNSNGKELLFDARGDPQQRSPIKASQAQNMVNEMKNDFDLWWDIVKVRASEYCHTYITRSESVTLNSMDLHSNPIWMQSDVAAGRRASGFWAVDVREAGSYIFQLRRWPVEADTALGAVNKVYPRSRPLYIARAKIRIEFLKNRFALVDFVDVDSEQLSADIVIDRLPQGKAFIQAVFLNKLGNTMTSAYYVTIVPV